MSTVYKDYYQILGVSRTASLKEIQTAYHRLALKYHPDRNAGSRQAEEKFKEINEAHQILGNPEKRAHYDLLNRAPQVPPNYARSTSQGTATARPASAPQPRPSHFSRHVEKIAIPANLEVIREAQRLRIVRKWPLISAVLQAGPGLFFFVPLFWVIFIIFQIFPPLAIAIGGGLAYFVLANCLNETEIEVDAKLLSIKHGPLPFPLWPDKKLSVSSLKLIFPDKNLFYYGRDAYVATVSHRVNALKADFSEVVLLNGMGSQEEAEFIAQEIAEFLHLQPA